MRVFLLVLAAVLLASAGSTGVRSAPRPGGEGAAVAVSAALSVDEGRTRLTVVLSRDIVPSGFLLERPDRAVIDMPNVNCQLPPDATRRVGIVTGFRCGLSSPDRARLIIELGVPAAITRLEMVEGPVPSVRYLVVELAKADRDGMRQAASASDRAPETTGSIGSPARPTAPLVAIDPGHGGVDPGATAATGDVEKDIVLAFARTLRDHLVASGRVRVLMTRESDVFVPLDERVRIARSAGADLFVSIHGDSIASPTVRGATIYTGAERATDAESARLADRENAADRAGGLVPPEVRAGVTDILHELTLRETRGLSHRVAARLHADLGSVMRFSPQPHREAGFRVLRAPDMTSVLVELGYLSNVQDAGLLLSDDWRGRTAAAMATAIERFFGPRLVAGAPVSP